MAILKDAYVKLGSTDYSASIVSIDVPQSVETVDDTAMGDDFRSSAASLNTWEVSGTYNVAYGASTLELELSTAWATSAKSLAIEIRPTSGSVAAGNPKWTGTGILTEHGAVSGSVGDQQVGSFKLVAGSDLTRATS